MMQLASARSDHGRGDAENSVILELKNLAIGYGEGDEFVRIVHDVSFLVRRGESLAVVGESGCGKSQTMLAVLRLLARGGRIVAGDILLEGRSLLALNAAQMRAVRGKDIAWISQDALSALNPSKTIFRQMSEPMIAYGGASRAEAARRCVDLLDRVGIPGARARLSNYPHELSGGMRQRALIAMAISSNPKVLIADEPTTALDVTIQAQILDLIDDLRRDLGMALVLITHNLGVVAGVSDRVVVMYAGRVVETGTTDELFLRPRHPYTRALLNSIPKMDGLIPARLTPIPGLPPDPQEPFSGCPYSPRCGFVQPVCKSRVPDLAVVDAGCSQAVRCTIDPFNPVRLSGACA